MRWFSCVPALAVLASCNCDNRPSLVGVDDAPGGGTDVPISGSGGGAAIECVPPGGACGGELATCCTGVCNTQNQCPAAEVPDAGEPDAGAPDAGVPDAGAGCGADGTSCGVVETCRPMGQCRAGVCEQPPATACGVSDLQVFAYWGSQSVDLQAHLVRPGGHINDASGSDCTASTCIGRQPDWGAIGDPTDDPSEELTDSFGDVIVLNKPVDGDYAVYVENRDPTIVPLEAKVVVFIHQQWVFEAGIDNFAAHNVWDVARIHWPDATVTATGNVMDCSSSWTTGGCGMVLP